MKAAIFAALALLAILLPNASAIQMNISITLSSNDIAKETFYILPDDFSGYDNLQFHSAIEPLSVDYPGQYSIEQNGSDYIINIIPEKQDLPLVFSVLYDSLVDKTSKGKVFRTIIKDSSGLHIDLALPEGAYLANGNDAIPEPAAITSDGKSIKLTWDFTDGEEANLAVFYIQGSQLDGQIIAITITIIALVITALGFSAYLLAKRKVKNIINETLSPDESSIAELLRKGVTKQKEIGQTLGFSKSKLSKVIRKLEEKKLIEKTPFFKTNKLELKKIK
jgi:uncharacterized membrane protein